MKVVSKIAFFAARRDEETRLGEHLLSLVASSRSEPGSLRYEVFQDASDDGLWIVVEDWRSEGDFEQHMETAYVRAFLARVPDLCESEPDIRTYRKRSSTDGRTTGHGAASL